LINCKGDSCVVNAVLYSVCMYDAMFGTVVSVKTCYLNFALLFIFFYGTLKMLVVSFSKDCELRAGSGVVGNHTFSVEWYHFQ